MSVARAAQGLLIVALLPIALVADLFYWPVRRTLPNQSHRIRLFVHSALAIASWVFALFFSGFKIFPASRVQ